MNRPPVIFGPWGDRGETYSIVQNEKRGPLLVYDGDHGEQFEADDSFYGVLLVALAGLGTSHPRCGHCGAPAACLGQGEGMTGATYACDTCCQHGGEDSWCWPLAEIPKEVGELLASYLSSLEGEAPPARCCDTCTFFNPRLPNDNPGVGVCMAIVPTFSSNPGDPQIGVDDGAGAAWLEVPPTFGCVRYRPAAKIEVKP